MKDQYFGDINDYFKYGILRCFADAGLSIGVCWMMTPNDGRADGRKIKYLTDGRTWKDYDPDLFDSLAEAVKRHRGIRQIKDFQILPDCSFCSDVVPDSQRLRNRWLSLALSKLSGVDLLFFDPDNGIEVRSTPIGKRGSSKFLYWHEIEEAWAQGCSLLIFQHFPRQNRKEYVSRLVSELSKHVLGGQVVPLITSNVVYLLAYRECHRIKVTLALEAIAKTWQGQVWTRRTFKLD
ncbi:MAG TPA: hypothetical protein VEW46_22205 [Pyrinomonadaceae bacterium]|nr:hypothetical protein [Pyrinomonadaceae bacterium]